MLQAFVLSGMPESMKLPALDEMTETMLTVLYKPLAISRRKARLKLLAMFQSDASKSRREN
jgi:hypothetical protein